MHDLPVTVLQAKDRRYSKLEGRRLASATHLRLPPFILDKANEIGSNEQREVVVRPRLRRTIAKLRRRACNSGRHVGPSATRWSPRVGECDVIAMRVQPLKRFGVAVHDVAQRVVVRLEGRVEIHNANTTLLSDPAVVKVPLED